MGIYFNVMFILYPLTMCDSLPAACHDAVTQLNYLRDADNLLGVVTLI